MADETKPLTGEPLAREIRNTENGALLRSRVELKRKDSPTAEDVERLTAIERELLVVRGLELPEVLPQDPVPAQPGADA